MKKKKSCTNMCLLKNLCFIGPGFTHEWPGSHVTLNIFENKLWFHVNKQHDDTHFSAVPTVRLPCSCCNGTDETIQSLSYHATWVRVHGLHPSKHTTNSNQYLFLCLLLVGCFGVKQAMSLGLADTSHTLASPVHFFICQHFPNTCRLAINQKYKGCDLAVI